MIVHPVLRPARTVPARTQRAGGGAVPAGCETAGAVLQGHRTAGGGR